MRPTFFGIETAKRSLFANQAVLNTIGHNIANLNTAGYSRQRVNLIASMAIEYPGIGHSAIPGQAGTGVDMGSVMRIRDRFLDRQFRDENKNLGNWEMQANTLSRLEGIMKEPSETGLRKVLENFWKSWSDLTKDPENITGKKLVRENAIALTDAMNQISKQLNDVTNGLNSSIDIKVDEANSALKQIAELNEQIARVEIMGDQANDLRDQRDLLVDELSKKMNITVKEGPDGYSISMGGVNLVSGKTTNPITKDSIEGSLKSGDLTSGEFVGLITSRDKYVNDYKKQLDDIANTIANGDITITIPKGSVLPEGTVLNGVTYTGDNRTLTEDLTVTVKGLNGLHQLGYTNGNPLEAGGPFFTTKDGSDVITADNICLNPDIVNDPNKIATSMRTEGSGANEKPIMGNNSLATLISGLKDTKFTFSGAGSGVTSGTISDFYGSMVGQMGIQSKEAIRQYENEILLVGQADARRMSVSAVSEQEELSEMIKFQHSYGAAARFMTTYDQLLEKLINGTGVVGR
ncbi:flagellar hook-associated protein 1 [Paenibacillus larvae subsp. larvae]|uniref:Flagellar hook-associated protein 1 n=1 Tax=Paenibacillus larvae subsp. larvae TaxID=147375 RepID=A0A2L1TUQ2_9BACL|nr:flagellar hook-associated protein FlgK [Paenibacillus larvae]AQT85091.1 flagellar hook-associated protein FlgK [Paenibacillus larvae subsp. pulvifaciens]AQZ47094.1 flagellar hook-associated protein FlgK [Paenibacillus larvae subsp. pulvifaciens]AVF24374.1 flagellar hook-associated protein 1 [Paenibacillus larvae subsp. larvae]AVF29135.1 flagellar hook-associated protein 1 [Paenibacillus larvae subsp. larvae]MBH0341342.1 flagellar hook protein FlgK [Paenibacillus larvae]